MAEQILTGPEVSQASAAEIITVGALADFVNGKPVKPAIDALRVLQRREQEFKEDHDAMTAAKASVSNLIAASEPSPEDRRGKKRASTESVSSQGKRRTTLSTSTHATTVRINENVGTKNDPITITAPGDNRADPIVIAPALPDCPAPPKYVRCPKMSRRIQSLVYWGTGSHLFPTHVKFGQHAVGTDNNRGPVRVSLVTEGLGDYGSVVRVSAIATPAHGQHNTTYTVRVVPRPASGTTVTLPKLWVRCSATLTPVSQRGPQGTRVRDFLRPAAGTPPGLDCIVALID